MSNGTCHQIEDDFLDDESSDTFVPGPVRKGRSKKDITTLREESRHRQKVLRAQMKELFQELASVIRPPADAQHEKTKAILQRAIMYIRQCNQTIDSVTNNLTRSQSPVSPSQPLQLSSDGSSPFSTPQLVDNYSPSSPAFNVDNSFYPAHLEGEVDTFPFGNAPPYLVQNFFPQGEGYEEIKLRDIRLEEQKTIAQAPVPPPPAALISIPYTNGYPKANGSPKPQGSSQPYLAPTAQQPPRPTSPQKYPPVNYPPERPAYYPSERPVILPSFQDRSVPPIVVQPPTETIKSRDIAELNSSLEGMVIHAVTEEEELDAILALDEPESVQC